MNIFQNDNSEFLVRNGAFLRTKDDLEFFNLLKNSKFGEPHKNRLEIFNKINIENKIKKFQLFETKTHLQSLLLRSDKMMMAHSVEARVPYLDTDLFNYSINISDKIKKANIQKIVLKKILSKYGYSSSFVNRKKIGYLIPFNQWINSQKKIVNELNDEILLQLFNRKYLEIIKNNISTNKNIYSSSKFFWLFLNLKKFIRIFEIDVS